MYNDLFSIGPLTVHGYGLMIGIGVVAALLIGDKRANKRGLNGEIIYGMTLWAIVLGFLAARILFIITEWSDFIKHPIDYITGNGFVVFGGIIGGALTAWGYCAIKKVSAVTYLDLMTPSVAIAQGFGRLGCLLAGCCYGRETSSPLGIVFTHSDFAPNGVRLIPTQIIMSVGDFAIGAILLLYASKPRKKGEVSCLYIALYSIGRFFVEFLRNDYRGSVGILSTSQFIGIIAFAIAVAAYIWFVPFLNKGCAKETENKEE
ncbi:MAG: prolipoprotein diacylglyceryl transferase [Lachnospiraceae bacterium]|nr:prolipoprotein diacylglyceryl transferase [Candidatus Colinaster equi]